MGQEVLARLVATSDIVIHNIRSSAAAQLGLTYTAMSRYNERIIVVAARGYSDRSDDANKPAYDDIIQAASGIAYLEGLKHGSPQYLPTIVADKTAGITAVYAALAALYERERTGLGQEVEVPMYDVMAQYMSIEHYQGEVFEPMISPSVYQRVVSRNRKPYATADGHISVMLYTDRHWRAFFDRIGRLELADDPRFRDISHRTEHIDELYQLVADVLVERKTSEWLDVFREIDAPATPVRSVADVLTDPGLFERGVFRTVEHPTEGTIHALGLPLTYGRTEVIANDDRLAPRLGQHSIELLNELGYPAVEIAEMVEQGLVVAADGASLGS
jgi:crotonobetainyl-CoA:carnitine CoA-transferase CaiB-like acyl-CoA transferase